MLGLFVLAALGVGAMVHSCKNEAENTKDRNDAASRGQEYYLDNLGKTRSVKNNHQVLRRTTGGTKYNWDTVDLDMKTGQVLRNYTQEKRDEISAEKRIIHEENKKSKQKAIEEGRYWYSVKEPPIERYSQYGARLNYYTYQHDLNSALRPMENLSCYEYHKYRLSDGLLLEDKTCHSGIVREFKCGFIVYDYKAEENGDEKKIMEHAKLNSSRCRSEFVQSKTKMTDAELFIYAKKIGAYLEED